MLSVVLIEETAAMQQALRLLLSTVAGVDVHGTASGLPDGLALVADVRPRVLIVGTVLRHGASGLDLLRRLPEVGVAPRISVIAGDLPAAVRAAYAAAGAEAFFDPATDGTDVTRWMQGQVAESGVLSLADD